MGFKNKMLGAGATGGMNGETAHWICTCLNDDDSRIYLGYKRMHRDAIITHDMLLNYMQPGNCVIIFKTFYENEVTGVVKMGHYTSAWVEEGMTGSYFHFDSLNKKEIVQYCEVGVDSEALDWQTPDEDNLMHRVLFIFNLPTDKQSRQKQVEHAVANLTAIYNRTIQILFQGCKSYPGPVDIVVEPDK